MVRYLHRYIFGDFDTSNILLALNFAISCLVELRESTCDGSG